MWASHYTEAVLVGIVGTVILKEKLTNAFDEPCGIINVLIPATGKLRVYSRDFEVDCNLDKVLNISDSTTCEVRYLVSHYQLYGLLYLLRFVYCQVEPM